jgi:DNA-binding NarL/FixJ family response regulator
VLLVDVAAGDSLLLPRESERVAPGTLSLAFGVTEAEPDVVACAEAGMCGYVHREASITDLIGAVYDAVNGQLACSPRIAAILFGRLAPSAGGRGQQRAFALLTQREREVADLAAQGLSNKGIARRLALGTPTVKNHMHSILQKLDMQRRSQIAALLPPPRPEPKTGRMSAIHPD